MPPRAPLPRLVLLAALLACPPLAAHADDTEPKNIAFFCVAISFQTHTAYITELLNDYPGKDDMEQKLGKFLDQESLPYQNVQCPLPQEGSAAVMAWTEAENFNRKLGNKIVRISSGPQGFQVKP
ncbi:hypothetical protein [Methylovirgula sp. 4M-Z18]|uniref:hypothetical protein n=1 Tax=Methylovirgula sp. 4M-Z18 TaxID=2293567 RepID=UPI000E2ED24E|nr:hypothetical protein [Methylovirgula sp. 4M-Z18]RFB79655.1 hypothetical protein DYH55_09210 [Methylovirgula sp. 4M-Z18]